MERSIKHQINAYSLYNARKAPITRFQLGDDIGSAVTCHLSLVSPFDNILYFDFM